jgi:hypothetical protein
MEGIQQSPVLLATTETLLGLKRMPQVHKQYVRDLAKVTGVYSWAIPRTCVIVKERRKIVLLSGVC